MERDKPVNLVPSAILIEQWTSFTERLGGFSEADRDLIRSAYNIAFQCHSGQFRENGDPYFKHVLEVVAILMDECHITDAKMIAATLLHDTGEDSVYFGQHKGVLYSQWKETATAIFTNQFGDRKELLHMFIALTKPKPDGVEIQDKPAATRRYIQNLAAASPKTLLVKMADRLHNLRTLKACSPDKQKRVISETRRLYLPCFLNVLTEFPDEGKYLLMQIIDEVNKFLDEFNAEKSPAKI